MITSMITTITTITAIMDTVVTNDNHA